jgi:hypothetical protein
MPKSLIICVILILTIISDPGLAQYQNIQVNSDALTNCNEPSIALNPNNPENIVIGANNTYYFYTFDGGVNWGEGQMFSSMGVWGDPSLGASYFWKMGRSNSYSKIY